MKYNLLIILLCVFSSTFGQTGSKKENYKPVNLEEAVEQLKIIHHDSTKQKILEMTEDEFLGGSHMGLGMWMRNNWGLWKGKELANYFNSIGIYHPDDMSGIILTSYYRELHGQEWKVDEQVKYYQDYWKKSNEHFQKLETDTAYQKMIQARQDSIEHARFLQKKSELSEGKQVVGYLGYQCRLLELGMKTKIEGTVVEWTIDYKLVIQIDNYFEANKMKRVKKCNDVQYDTVVIENHSSFRLKEK
jgi:uncharacterized protein DUF6794